MKKLVIDIDNTITIEDYRISYEHKQPNKILIERIREYKSLGFEIILFTARNMKTYKGNIGKINKYTAPILINWLEENNVPYDEIIFGKPWCGTEGFYVDDKAIRPSEFINKDFQEIKKLLDVEKK